MEFYGEYMEIYGSAMGFYVKTDNIRFFFDFDVPAILRRIKAMLKRQKLSNE